MLFWKMWKQACERENVCVSEFSVSSSTKNEERLGLRFFVSFHSAQPDLPGRANPASPLRRVVAVKQLARSCFPSNLHNSFVDQCRTEI